MLILCISEAWLPFKKLPKIRQTKLSDLLDFLFLYNCSMAFWGLNYSRMANLGSRTYCNTFLIIFGTSKNNRPNIDPHTRYLSQKHIYSKTQEIWKHFINMLVL